MATIRKVVETCAVLFRGFPSLPMLPSLATSRTVIFASFDALDELVEFVLGSDVVDGLRPDFCVVARGVSEKRTPRAARGGSGVRGAHERSSPAATFHMCE